MTVREYARIHGFPDAWFFAGINPNGAKQAANAVLIPLGIALFRSIRSAVSLDGRLSSGELVRPPYAIWIDLSGF